MLSLIARIPNCVLLWAALASTLCVGSPARAAVGTVLLVVQNPNNMSSDEIATRSLIQSWGYTVTTLSSSANQATTDASVRASSVAYVCESANASALKGSLLSAPIGVVIELAGIADDMKLSTSTATFSDTKINIVNTSHYITSVFPSGNLTIANSLQPLWKLAGTQASLTTLGRDSVSASPAIAILDWNDTLTSGGGAAGRRVTLPFGSGFDMTQLTANGKTLIQRSIEWCLQPEARWKLDETTGSVASDDMGGNNGALSGPTWSASGQRNGALRFDGLNDYVSIPDGPQFRPTTALTIAGWIKGSSWPNNSTWTNIILRKGDANPTNWQLSVWQTKATLTLDTNDDSGISGNTSLATNTWYHIAATWDGVTAKVYVNGVLDMTPVAKAAPLGTDTRPVYLGGRTGSTDVVNGWVDDVYFFSRALTQPEIAKLMTPSVVISNWHDVAP